MMSQKCLMSDESQKIAFLPTVTGETIIVDPELQNFLSNFIWRSDRRNHYWTSIGKKHVRIHRMIMLAQPGEEVDHIDGNPLNNLTSNLRFCSHKENMRNRKVNKNNRSGYKGVIWVSQNKKYRAQIRIDGKLIYLGFYDNPKDAAEAYNKAALKHFKNFARINKYEN